MPRLRYRPRNADGSLPTGGTVHAPGTLRKRFHPRNVFERAARYKRRSTAVNMLMTRLGFTDERLRDLYIPDAERWERMTIPDRLNVIDSWVYAENLEARDLVTSQPIDTRGD